MNHDLIIAVILTFVGFVLGKLIIYLVGYLYMNNDDKMT